jgi:SAM-dependent methyltransferase
MDRSLVERLIDPASGEPLGLIGAKEDSEGRIESGELRSASGRTFPIQGGIPRFVKADDASQEQTADSFGYKWNRQDSYDSPAMRKMLTDWQHERYGFESRDAMRRFFSGHRRILDAGCGSGLSISLWMDPEWRGESEAQYFGADISNAVDVAYEKLDRCPGAHFIQADLMDLPFERESFDAVWSDGVLHHTPSTRAGLEAITKMIRSGGEAMFYVYLKKGAIREFTDDYVRGVLSEMSPGEAWEALRPLTALGQALANMKAEIDLPEDIPYLGIKAGKLDVQRFVYWNMAKVFWRDDYSFEENHHINFDWYHPKCSHRQTEEQVRSWCRELGLEIKHANVQESGITIRATKT